MAERPRVFLDTSALIAGILSPTGGARAILLQGEHGLIELWVRRYVLAELEEVMRRKLPDRLGDVALLLDAARVKIGPDPDDAQLAHTRGVVEDPKDVPVLAGVLAAGADYLVTHDAGHLLSLPPEASPVQIVNPGALLAALRAAGPSH